MRFSLFVICCIPLCGHGGEFELSRDDINEALGFVDAELALLVRNAAIQPHWMAGGHQLWYERDDTEGRSIVVVDAVTGEKTAPNDAAFSNGEAGSPPETATDALVSPDGKHAVFVRDYNLWLRNLGDGSESALTNDGEHYAAYASPFDQQTLHLPPVKEGDAAMPVTTYWSPDSRRILTRHVDEREVLSYPFFQAVPGDGGFRPQVREKKVTLLGDEHKALVRDIIIDVETASSRPIALPQGFDLEDAYPGNTPLAWDDSGSRVFVFASTIDAQIGRLLEVDMASGDARTVLEETAPGSRVYLSPLFGRGLNFRIIGDEFTWYSERDGYGHLYLYELSTGKMLRQLTRGDGPVDSVIHVDPERRSLLVSKGRGGDADPYERVVYRVSLDGEDSELLTPENGHHVVPPGGVSPDGEYFVDTYSTVSMPPRAVLQSVWKDAAPILLEEADASALFKKGWRPPHRVRVKAADGKTDLYAVVFEPYQDLEDDTLQPVVDLNYINSIVSIAPVGFSDAFRIYYAESLRHLGFYVVVVDGRGTPMRSRKFREAGYPVFYDLQVDDHAAAIEQLADRFAGMDVERVGIWGSSNGGAGAARAVLQRPNFFKVAVASAGSHDYMSLPPSGEKYFGVVRYPNGSAIRPTPGAIPENYAGFDNAALAGNLRGHLLLAFGDFDNAALPTATHRLINALIEEGKAFDVLPMPNRGHFFLLEPYFKRRLVDYFIEHLHGIDIPAN